MRLLKCVFNKKGIVVEVVLGLYIGFILWMTLICREPSAEYQYNLELFWSYRQFDIQAKQIGLNILLFIPFGMLLFTGLQGNLKKRMIVTIIIGCLLSVLIEASQLVFKLGFCELDDVLDNTIGAFIGSEILFIIEGRWRKDMHKPFGPYEKYFKRPIDLFCGLAAVIVFCWLYVILIVLGAIFMRGNPFFTQERPGKDEKIFKLIKFRTMDNRKDKDGNLLPDDVRLNKYGRFLRSTSLDELPEAFNIIKGDMSVIGPRPLLVSYLPYYTEKEHHRHDVRPGLSGWAQINGRNAIDSWEQRFQYDLEYVNHISLWFDIKIIVMTVLKVIKHSDIQVGSQIKVGRLDDARRGKTNEGNNQKV